MQRETRGTQFSFEVSLLSLSDPTLLIICLADADLNPYTIAVRVVIIATLMSIVTRKKHVSFLFYFCPFLLFPAHSLVNAQPATQSSSIFKNASTPLYYRVYGAAESQLIITGELKTKHCDKCPLSSPKHPPVQLQKRKIQFRPVNACVYDCDLGETELMSI